jgi:hypothetical protein
MNEETRSAALAKVMFAAYNAAGPNPGKTWNGKDVPPWEKCGEQVQTKWTAAAEAAFGAVIDPNGPCAEKCAEDCSGCGDGGR